MSERTLVWVQTPVLKKALGIEPLSSPLKSSSKKKKDDYDRSGGEWNWVLAEVVAGDISAVASHSTFTSALKVKVMDEESDLFDKQVEMKADLLKSNNSGSVVEMANEYIQQDELPPDDLITLTHLHEPAVVTCLRKRYMEDVIYTATGPILLVVNPYKHIRGLYEDASMNKYWAHGEKVLSKKELNEGLKPHIYGNADAAFRKLMVGLDLKKNGLLDVVVNQSILVSGESGAGKTVTTKHIMKYLATLSQRKAEHAKRRRAPSPGRGENSPGLRRAGSSMRGLVRNASWKAGAQIEEKILQSNPILESFGNARTIRNDNSSRFGKFIELQFKKTGSLIGAAIDTYLLETVRLIFQGPGERNFHIFYEMLAAATKEERRQFYLNDYTPKDFKMTSASGTFDRRDGADDAELFDKLVLALSTMGFDAATQDDIFGVTTAFLHASNLTMVAVTDDSSKVDESNPHLVPVLKLLGLSKDAFESAICQFEIEAGNTSYTKQLSKEFAEKSLEALVKSTYGAMFNFIVQSINKKIDYKPKRGEPLSLGKAGYIGVLDIFGFESFQDNSFEQLCINYCNEALQQQFNLFIFKTEQAEYQKEGIEWKFIEFPDNQDVIELIDKKGSGIISILTDQCRNLRGTDKTFQDQIYKLCEPHARFEAPGLVKANGQFVVHHYAGPVKYGTEGFVEKNKNEIPRGASDLLIHSSNAFVQLLGQITTAPTSSNKKAGAKRPTVGSTFTLQLSELRKRIDMTAPHYVRCLKPNQDLLPNDFHNGMIADQLKYAGVLEAIRVSRVGYSQRYDHLQFVQRYRFIAMTKVKAAPEEERVRVLVDAIANKIWKAKHPNDAIPSDILGAVGIQVGESKVFLRQAAFDYMESFRTQQLGACAIVVEAQARMFIQRCRYLREVELIILVQACARRFISRKYLVIIRKRKAATAMQSLYRMHVVHDVYLKKKYVALWCQKYDRGRVGRERFAKLDAEHKKKVAMEALDYRSATAIQCMYRVWKAKAIRRALSAKRTKLEARSSIARRQDAAKDKAKIETYRAKAIAKQVAFERDKEVDALQKELNEQTSNTTKQLEASRAEVAKLKAELETSKKELEASRKSAETALFKLATAETENKKLKDQLNSGGFVSGMPTYASTAFDEHEDLKQLDERIFGITARAQQGKKDLQSLVASLAILK